MSEVRSEPYVGWVPVEDNGQQQWIRMRSGGGESGWWHRHADDPDAYGGNPADYDRDELNWKCRTCGRWMLK